MRELEVRVAYHLFWRWLERRVDRRRERVELARPMRDHSIRAHPDLVTSPRREREIETHTCVSHHSALEHFEQKLRSPFASTSLFVPLRMTWYFLRPVTQSQLLYTKDDRGAYT